MSEPLDDETAGLEEIDDGLRSMDCHSTPLAMPDERGKPPKIRPIWPCKPASLPSNLSPIRQM